MTIPLTGQGALFNRIGALGRLLLDANTYAASTLPGDFERVESQFCQAVGPAVNEADIIAPFLQLLQGVQGGGGETSLLQGLAAQTLNRMVYRDNPRLLNTDVGSSMVELIRQMKLNGNTVSRCQPSVIITAAAGNTGNGNIVSSVVRGDGLLQENVLAERGLLTCTGDAQAGNVAAGSEFFQWTGTPAENDPMAFDWPLGSSSSTGLQAVDASLSGGGAFNLIANGDFETWAAGAPANWVQQFGDPTHAVQSTRAYTGLSSLQFISDGITPQSIVQGFNNTLGNSNPAQLLPDVTYAWNLWLAMDQTVNSGVLRIDLNDGNNNPIIDDQGNSNSTSINLSTVPATFAAFSGTWRTPRVLPALQYVRLYLSVVPPAGRSVYIDRFALAVMTRLYPGGPYLTIFSGSVPFIAISPADYYNVQVNNVRAGNPAVACFQTLFDRLFGMRQLGLLLPSAVPPANTIADTLITNASTVPALMFDLPGNSQYLAMAGGNLIG